METIELNGWSSHEDHGSMADRMRRKVREDRLTISAVNLVFEDRSSNTNEKVSVKIPSIPIGFIMRKLERLVAEEEFRRDYFEKFDLLTKREIQILRLLAEGYNNRQISEKLFISRRTVEQHHKNLNKKLAIKSYVDLINYSLAFNLI